jgi:magnesium transporter
VAPVTVAAANFYSRGHRVRELTLLEEPPGRMHRSEFAWIDLSEPSAGELEALGLRYGLHPLVVMDALSPDQIPKLEVRGQQLFVVTRTARLESDSISYGSLYISVDRHHIICVRHGPGEDHAHLRRQLEHAPGLLAQGVDYVLHAVLTRVVDDYLPIFEMIEDDVLAMERRSVDSFLGRDEVTRIFGLRRELTRFRRTLAPMVELVRKLVRGHYPCISAEARPYFDDVLDHVVRVRAMVDGLLLELASVFEFSSLLEQQRTGVTTRQLAAWAAILAVPTAVAGIYGMNFRNMPELQAENGYFITIGTVALLCVALYVRFKRAGWL